MVDGFKIRPCRQEDMPFIYSSFLNSRMQAKDIQDNIGVISRAQLKNLIINSLNDILDNKTQEIKVCCLQDDEDTIVGYSIFANDELQWTYVKHLYRRNGIATALVGAHNAHLIKPCYKE